MGLNKIEEKAQKARETTAQKVIDEQAKIKLTATQKKEATAAANKKAEEEAVLQAKFDAKVTKNADIKKATRTKITYDVKGLVTKGETATTDDIDEITDKRYLTDAERTILQTTSGTNTGDETQSTIIAKIGYTPENVANKQANLTASATKYPNVDAVIAGLATKENLLGFIPENVANKEDAIIDTSTTKYPTVNLLRSGLSSKLSAALTDTNIFVGNVANVATGVAVSGDITISNAGVVTVANDAITFAKMQNITTARLLGRTTALSGDTEELSVGTGLSLSAGSLNLNLGAIDHNALLNLAAGDVHTQYALLVGRPGGQTWTGGTGVTDKAIIRATSGVGTTGAGIIFQVGNNGGTEAMRILNSGELLIGASAKLSTWESLLVQKNQNALSGQIIANTTSGAAARAALSITTSATNSPNVTFQIFSAGYTTSGMSVADTGSLISNAAAGFNIGTINATQLALWTNAIERMRITTDGDFGIGLVVPAQKFHIRKNVNGETSFQIDNANTGASAYTSVMVTNGTVVGDSIRVIALGTGWTTTGAFVQDSGVISTELNMSGGLSIGTRHASAPIRFFSGGHTNERARITETGLVGIGQTVPTGQCHIKQPSLTGAIPVLTLEQLDVSEQFFDFITTIGVGNAIEAAGAKVLSTTHFIKITIPGGLTRFIPCGTIA